MMTRFLSLLIVLFFLPLDVSAATWTIDKSHSEIGFSIRHMMVSNTKGKFDKYKAEIELDEKDLSKSKVSIEIDAASINTSHKKRDAHLRDPDFLEVEKYPTIKFVSETFKKKGERWVVVGKMTMHGVTLPLELDVLLTPTMKNPWGKTIRGAEIRGQLSRKAFGLTYNRVLEAGGVAVGDEVKFLIDLELHRQ